MKDPVSALSSHWKFDKTRNQISRDFRFKGYAKAVRLVNLCAWLADQEGHHPDIAFGWGYVVITLTTHDEDGLTDKDFRWAHRLDAIVDAPAD